MPLRYDSIASGFLTGIESALRATQRVGGVIASITLAPCPEIGVKSCQSPYNVGEGGGLAEVPSRPCRSDGIVRVVCFPGAR